MTIVPICRAVYDDRLYLWVEVPPIGDTRPSRYELVRFTSRPVNGGHMTWSPLLATGAELEAAAASCSDTAVGIVSEHSDDLWARVRTHTPRCWYGPVSLPCPHLPGEERLVPLR